MKISVCSLGGVGEIGMNMYIYETDNSAIIVDCGVKFAGASEPSIDVIIPDFSYLETIKNKLKCIFITHAHEDHIGALSFLLHAYNIPIVAGKFSMDLADYKLKERDISIEKIYLPDGDTFDIGDFSARFIPISHSIPGTKALFLKASDGFSVLHMSDYKIDFSSVSGSSFDMKPFLDIGDDGLSCLVADSTNALSSGFTNGEKDVCRNLEEIFEESKGRIFFTSFASNSERIGAIISIAEKYGRKVVLEGKSLQKNIETARKNGLLNISPNTLIPAKMIERVEDHSVCIIATGSQGERSGVIFRISSGDYSSVTIRPTDLFIFSSRVIPGNEQNIITVMNNIALLGGKCLSVHENRGIHSSGHAAAEDMRLLLKLTRPLYLIPVHGEYIHLRKHIEIGVSCGLEEEYILDMSLGAKAIFEDGVFEKYEEIHQGKNFVDIKGSSILTSEELQLRKKLSWEGGVFVYADPDLEKGAIERNVIISAFGFQMDSGMTGNLAKQIKDASETELFERFSKEGWLNFITKFIKKYFKKAMGRRPIISVIIGENE